MGKIVVKNAVERKTGWLYYIDAKGNLCGYDIRARQKSDVNVATGEGGRK